LLSPAEGSALIASTANRMDETCEVTAETADRVASMQELETERARKGTWPKWARLETGPTEEHAGLHCSICEAHANPNGEGQRVGALITDGAVRKNRNTTMQLLTKHPNTRQHKTALENQATAIRGASSDPNTTAAPGGQMTLQETLAANPTVTDGIRKRMLATLWLCREGIAVDKYPSLMAMLISIGAFDAHAGTDDGDIGSTRASYRDVKSAWGFIDSMAAASRERVHKIIRKAPAVGMTTDEATDSATQSQQVFGYRVPVLDEEGFEAKSYYGGVCIACSRSGVRGCCYNYTTAPFDL